MEGRKNRREGRKEKWGREHGKKEEGKKEAKGMNEAV